MKPVGVAAIAAVDPDGQLLMGRRADDGTWCAPGGHIEEGENPLAAAHRELEEETGLTADAMEPIAAQAVKDGDVHVYAFRAEVDGEPTNDKDPDAEFTEFRWVDPNAVPQEILRNLHNQPDVVLQALGAGGQAWKSFDEEAA